jgi:hypothetical protein
MDSLRYEVSEGMTIRLTQVDSDAVIQAGAQDAVELVLDGETDQCTTVSKEDALEIASRVPLSISVPPAAAVHVGEVSGDLILRGLDGTVTVETVHGECLLQSGGAALSIKALHGDLTAEGVSGTLSANDVHADVRLGNVDGGVVLGSVRGDVRARIVNSSLQMGRVGGDVRLREIQGEVSLEEGNGDFKGTDLRGGMNVQRVKGMLTLKSTLTPGLTYRARADGDIVVRCPEGTSAQFTLEAKGGLRATLPEMEEASAERIVGRSGDGEAQVEFSAGGELSLKIRGQRERFEMPFDFGPDIAAEIEAQITETLGALDFDAIARREIEKATRKAEREIEKASLRVERGRREAEEQMRRAQERAARAARRAHERFSHRGLFGEGGPFGGATHTFKFERGRPPKPKVSEEEQLAILKMVQEGKITIEEAEQLLKALEG